MTEGCFMIDLLNILKEQLMLFPAVTKMRYNPPVLYRSSSTLAGDADADRSSSVRVQIRDGRDIVYASMNRGNNNVSSPPLRKAITGMQVMKISSASGISSRAHSSNNPVGNKGAVKKTSVQTPEEALQALCNSFRSVSAEVETDATGTRRIWLFVN
ncbi:hypothetical protein BG004_005259 [Podila humilis]|nr:hypothetical protein BG004_005259 [Podila humilis]